MKRLIKISTADSQSVIDLIKNAGVNNRNKHISWKYHVVKDERAKEVIKTRYANTYQREADIMTKNLCYDIIGKYIIRLGIIYFFCRAKEGN